MKRLAVLAFIALCIILAGMFLLRSAKAPELQQSRSLAAQENMENYIRIIAHPIAYIPEKEIQIKLTIESFQNPDFLNTEFTEIVMLEDDNETPYTPVIWKELSRSPNSRSGVLIFKLESPPAKTLTLTVFEMEERVFKWTL